MNFLLLFLVISELVLHFNFEVKFIRGQTNMVALVLVKTIELVTMPLRFLLLILNNY